MNRNKIILQTLLICTLVASTMSSCKKDFFDINEDPNYPADVPVNFLLPSAQAAMAQVVGGTFNIYGGIWGQYWTQNPAASQYRTIEQYNITADEFDRPWTSMYADALADLRIMEGKAEGLELDNYVAIAKIMQAYGFQIMTDNFGDVPFSETLDLTNPLEPSSILFPKYDRQEDIYNGIIQMAKDGLGRIDYEGTTPADDDLWMHGDMEKWERFGNTLLLRMYMRLSEVKPDVAQAGIQELEANGALFLTGDENVEMQYGDVGGNTNPLFATALVLNFSQNLVASSTAIDTLLALNDPRIDVFYVPSNSGAHIGIVQGGFASVAPGAPVSLPGAVTGANDLADPTAPVILISGYESLFLQAEAAARGWLTGDAQPLYEEAITSSFLWWGLEDTLATNYLAQTAVAYPAGGSLEEQIEAIITQKWISMCGTQGNEAWNEWRRTEYPDFFEVSVEALNGGVFPQSFIYPDIEQTRNGSFPGQKDIEDKVWWDVD